MAWNPKTVAPSPNPGPPVLFWQYMFPYGGAAIDRSQVNPENDPQADLLANLVLPPAAANIA